MARRVIVHIDEEKCDGCGECVPSCAEGAIRVVDGKARLVADVLCDGLGACIGHCPRGAITVEEREAAPFDEAAVARAAARAVHGSPENAPACPGSRLTVLPTGAPPPAARASRPAGPRGADPDSPSQLRHWPVQLRLVPPQAPFLAGADLIVCADCVPFAVPDFHERYLRGRAVLVGCHKLDDLAFYRDRLEEVFAAARPSRVTVLTMEVPCCSGLARVAIEAARAAGATFPLKLHVVGIRGGIEEHSVMGSRAASVRE